MVFMRRVWVAVIAGVLVLAVAATTWAVTAAPPIGTQLGRVVLLGGTSVPVHSPICPASVQPVNCKIVLVKSTALETITNRGGFPTSVKQSGEIVGFTIGLAQLSTNTTTANQIIQSLNGTYGGASEAQITVLKPGKKNSWTVVAEGPLVKLQPYFGYVVQFPLAIPIPVAKGEAIALTVPTWAPVLSFDLAPKDYAYKQSRIFNCSQPAKQQDAQNKVGQTTRYLCSYPGTRAEYSATELTTPVAPK
jgi:hypothetical protein